MKIECTCCTSGRNNHLPKSQWGDGPWQQEPDRVEFEHAGMPCVLHRGPTAGAWCGYVAVPPGHPAHGKEYDNVPSEVHGGLTYAAKCFGCICHTPKPGEPEDIWWFGFDCAHAGDACPAMNARLASHRIDAIREWETYRDIAYVRAETEALAEQLASMKG